jgi:hypothetical protein
LVQDGGDLAGGLADRAGADGEQFGQDFPIADTALVEDGGQDSLWLGDLLAEHAATGSWQAVSASPLPAYLFLSRGLGDDEFLDERGQVCVNRPGLRGRLVIPAAVAVGG